MTHSKLFLGIPIPAAIASQIITQVRLLPKKNIRFVPEQNYHITLKYIGLVENNVSLKIQDVLADLKIDEPIPLEIASCGYFGEKGRMRIIWAGIKYHHENLHPVVENIETLLSEFGIQKENRPFHPHLTLGRVERQPDQEFMNAFENIKNFNFGKFIARSMTLFQSGPEHFHTEFGTSAPVYSPIRSYPFETPGI